MLKKIWWLLAAAVMLSGLLGCGSTEEANGGDTAPVNGAMDDGGGEPPVDDTPDDGGDMDDTMDHEDMDMEGDDMEETEVEG